MVEEAAVVNGLLDCRTFIMEHRNNDDGNIVFKQYQIDILWDDATEAPMHRTQCIVDINTEY